MIRTGNFSFFPSSHHTNHPGIFIGAAFTCVNPANSCVFIPSSGSIPGAAGCCNTKVCGFRVACMDYSEVLVQSKCDDGCMADTYTAKWSVFSRTWITFPNSPLTSQQHGNRLPLLRNHCLPRWHHRLLLRYSQRLACTVGQDDLGRRDRRPHLFNMDKHRQQLHPCRSNCRVQ